MISYLLILAAITLLYYLTIRPYNYWSRKNVKTGKIIPFFGENFYAVFGRESFLDMVLRMYNQVPDVRYMGAYQFLTPLLIVKCPELIKKICIKDFDHFYNHRTFVPDSVDELLSKNLFVLKGPTWKNMRSVVSPTFTSSKMKSMFILINRNAHLFCQFFSKQEENIIELEFKDALTRYTNDVIANAAFGIEVDSLRDRENEFYVLGRKVTNFASVYFKFVIFLYQMSPELGKLLRVPLFGEKIRSYFTNLVEDNIRVREEQDIKRPDMLGILMEMRKGQSNDKIEEEANEGGFATVKEHIEMKRGKQILTNTDIVSQVFTFFMGGFEIVATAMCFMAYELAVNPDVQNRLIEEIEENIPQDEMPSYETIQKMTYMDMVVSEVLRLWPIAIMTDRVATKPYTIQPESPEEQSVELSVNDIVLIPIAGIHRDPKYYPNPNKFDPDRFSPENRTSIDPYTYLPFGVGPRNCIGNRFALLEMKALFCHLLRHFEIIPVEKTEIPLKMSKTSLSMVPDNGFPLALKKRNT